MKVYEVKNILLKELSLQEVYVSLCNDHYQVIAVDEIFSNMSMLDAHKLVYGPLSKYILSDEIHAVSIKTFAPQEWNKKRQFFDVL